MNKRTTRLIFTDLRLEEAKSQTSEGETLFRCDYGVPVLWLMCFGGRNIWNPGDDIVARGGAVGSRNPFETEIEVAATRLEHAESSLRDSERFWPWLSGIVILRRKLLARPKTGYIRMVSPWVYQLSEEEYGKFKQATAFSENAVNLIDAHREWDAVQLMNNFESFCYFVPQFDGKDRDRLTKLPGLDNETDDTMRLAISTVGTPSNRVTFDKAVMKDIAPIYQQMKELPPIAPPAAAAVGGGDTSDPGEKKGGFLGKLTGLFKRS